MRVLYKGLWVDPTYKMASYGLRGAVTNGCGKKGISSITPEHFWGLRVTEGCNIHDWDYHYKLISKHRANKWALVNWVRIVKKNTKWKWLCRLRLRRAKTYFYAVEKWGH